MAAAEETESRTAAAHCSPARVYCTAALTVALPVTVKLHVLVLLPEHAPDQIALLPPVRLRVTAVPMVKDPWPVDPDGTLMPDGLETTFVPLRPVAVTATVAV
jgi:hypothetical protein